jgi:hypothetical protein
MRSGFLNASGVAAGGVRLWSAGARMVLTVHAPGDPAAAAGLLVGLPVGSLRLLE